ncbi:2OG-Fe(II) oxygenase [Hyphobacterium sp. HN65]|uniref:2OG-Fe(II) oxygenase n=1 Tax=Hyphobacterium lacteum TaxID=3116575 RepID=A0ABU7LNJ4_9PROT|nr:2OG-Fe(II) oxygenase [Hyphobacterium sp. HN65]MEE2525181.1 2OG-Fe(II) oxygenase [Hyphobacterium sp. HN65]
MAKSGPGGIFDFDVLRSAEVKTSPYSYFIAKDALSSEESAEVRKDYPAIDKPGYLPLSKLESSGAFQRLMEDLNSPELAEVLTEKFGVDFTDKPRMITVRRLSQKSDGPIHNDSKSKILTMLTYLNPDWDGTGAGCIRVLNGKEDFEDYTEEVPPLEGYVFAFLRSDDSWHGHLPFEGERYVVQTTFLTSQEELDRKENRGGLQYFLKKLNPFQ